MYQVAYTNKFKKEYKLALKRGQNESLIKKVVRLLAEKKPLPVKHKMHRLSGEYSDCWECHILPDWLLIWQIDEATNTLTLVSTGTHSDLF